MADGQHVKEGRIEVMKALVVGCGSIGRRHINNLGSLDKIEIISVYTKVKDCLSFLDTTDDKVKVIENLDNPKADFAIVCNETYKHLDVAILLAQKGINLFIEKPISHNLNNIDKLKAIIAKKRLRLFIGYNLRFLHAMRFIKEQLDKNIIGDLYFANIRAGQYLPQWRQNIDYRDSYSADRDKGGGVSLDLSHEIDYMRYLFGDPIDWKIIKTKVSGLEIDSDDIFEGIYRFNNNFVCSVHLDYIVTEKERKIKIVGSKGSLQCDFIKKKIKIKKNNNEEITVYDDESLFDVDKTYIEELKHFIESIEADSRPSITIEDGVKALELIEG